MSPRAPFIVIEGLDRSGKSTQCTTLINRLEAAGIPAKLLKFPDRTTTIGQMIDAYLKSQSELDDHLIHLLFSANRWELASTIERLLREGTVVVCDRYAFSGIAFSASKGLPFEWCRAPDVSLPAPDLTLFLDISPEAAMARGGYGEERYEKREMQESVRRIFVRLAEEMNGEGMGDSRSAWITVDASQTMDDVSEAMWAHVQPMIGGTHRPIGRLWAGSFSSDATE
ncbi:hypothetical protein HGRIS_004580 [Hohenbuehelia grisea]|uniref:dTMP kinase n=1 Tax=Hohenbuehelia grisea TaxID=104357 RepID=A0ABR3JDZ8_9AGAR